MLGNRVVGGCAVACAKERQDGRLLGPPREKKHRTGRSVMGQVEKRQGKKRFKNCGREGYGAETGVPCVCNSQLMGRREGGGWSLREAG